MLTDPPPVTRCLAFISTTRDGKLAASRLDAYTAAGRPIATDESRRNSVRLAVWCAGGPSYL